MRVFKTKKELKRHISALLSQKNKIGFVPTMGALHKGHLSLVDMSKKENDFTIVSIFVNPTQFDKKEDLEKYPRTITQDLSLLEQINCDAVFLPSVEEIYDQDVSSQAFDFDGLENEMEGKFRDGHFDGVGTIVKAFFEIVTPTNAYFGEKDFQQLQIIKKMVEKAQLDVQVVGCPIFREANGLAMSSRNERLTVAQRNEGSMIYETLKSVNKKIASHSLSDIQNWVTSEFEKHPLFELEYFVVADEATLKEVKNISPGKSHRAFIAVYADSIRLIDNLSLNN
ncbi:pantoate--beta-alanine ligase [Pseudotenacibaculum haliotis]|uniref:Pantothenate synthetase n=1 Tax=Pseudotenacibaculum haliotis TaxID=1862138 RepID=A0ABW5LRT4_9FLAO